MRLFSRAISTFLGSPFRRALRSDSPQPIHPLQPLNHQPLGLHRLRLLHGAMLRREEAKYADRLARLPIRRKPVSKLCSWEDCTPPRAGRRLRLSMRRNG